MNSLILAAGKGTRLLPFTKKIPKCLVKIISHSLIERLVFLHQSLGFKINIITGYESRKLKFLKKQANLIKNNNFNNSNMLYSLFLRKELFNDSLIISYSDIYYPKIILNKLQKSRSNISVVVDKNWKSYWTERFGDPLIDSETLKLTKKNYLTEVGLKPASLKEINGQYIGLIKLNKKGSKIFKKYYRIFCNEKIKQGLNPKNAYLTDFIYFLINKNIKVKAVTTKNKWVEIDSVSDLKNPLTISRIKTIDKMNNFNC